LVLDLLVTQLEVEVKNDVFVLFVEESTGTRSILD
jgi:hypothetical protein